MPTNQSSPWDGGKLRTGSSGDSPPTTTSVSTHANSIVATKVPFSQTSLELSRRKDQAKPPSSNVASSSPPLRQTTVAPSAASVWDNGDRNKTNTQSQFAAVPDGSPDLPQTVNEIQSPNQVLAAGLKPAGSVLTESSAPSSIAKNDCQTGFNGLLTGTVQKCLLLQTSQHGNGLQMSKHQAATGDAPLGLKALLSVCYQDLLIRGRPSLQQTDKSMVSIDVSQCGSLTAEHFPKNNKKKKDISCNTDFKIVDVKYSVFVLV